MDYVHAITWTGGSLPASAPYVAVNGATGKDCINTYQHPAKARNGPLNTLIVTIWGLVLVPHKP